MDYIPHIYRNQNGLKPSFKYLNKRCLWFNSDFFSDFVLIDGKIYEISFDTNPFEIYKFNRLKVLTYIRDTNQSKPIQIKLKLPLAQSREVYNMDKESYPIIYSNHTAVESIQFNNNYSIRLIPQQIPRFTFRLDENYNSSLLSSGYDIIYNIFSYTGTIQTFNIPNNLTSLNIYCWGAGGSASITQDTANGGNGGFVKATLNIPSGTTSLAIIVGQGGGTSGASASRTAFGGGGTAYGGGSGNCLGGGGGMSGVFVNDANMTIVSGYIVNTNATAFIIAGGGGGAGLNGTGDSGGRVYNHGGNGGSTIGNAGSSYNPGQGGTQTAGGTKGTANSPYTAGNDGAKHQGGSGSIYQAGGGGGYYGGGSGGVEANRLGAGGGGSSFINTGSYTITNITNLKTATNGTTTAPGNTETYYQTGIAAGGTPNSSTGGNGLVVIEYFKKRIEGITPEETLIQTTNASIPVTINSKYQINYQTPIDLPKGTYQSIFDTGGIIFKDPLLIDKSYPILSINPTAWYKFDSGNLLTDSSGNNLTLTNVNSVELDTTNYIKGDASSSYLASSSRYLSINNAAFNLNGSSFSISVWVRPTLFNTGANETPIFATGDNNNNTRSSLFFQYTGNGGNLQAGFYGETTIVYPLTPANELNKWTHWCWTYNTTGNVHLLYKNGTYVGTYTGAGPLSGSGNNYRIGGWYLNSLEKYFTGSIDDFRLYKSQVLTPSEVTQLYNGNFDRSYPLLKDANNNIINPLAWYQFDNSSNNMLNDSSGNGYTLTNNNASYDTTNFIKGNASVVFTTTNNYLNFNNTIPFHTIQPATGLSISYWVRGLNTTASYGPHFFFANSVGGGSGNFYVRRTGSGNGLEVGLWGGSYEVAVISGNFFDATWKHITWTISTTGVWTFYVNGVNQSVSMTRGFVNYDYTTTIRKIGSSGSDFFGNIDDFRIYQIALSATQVSELYNGRISIYNPPGFMLGLELEDEILKLSNTISTI